MSTDPASSHIQNALELDVFMLTLERNLQYTSSPLKKFLLISEGYAQVRHLPESWLVSYLHGYADYFPKLALHPDISVTAPPIWDSALALLRFIRAHGWIAEDDREVFTTALEKSIFSFACVGAIEELHTVLQANVPSLSPLPKDALNRIYSVGSDEFSLFNAYRSEISVNGVLQKAFDAAYMRWTNFHEQENAVSIALLEDDGNRVTTLDAVAGRILSLEIRRQKAGLEIQLENHLDDTGTELIHQLRIAQQVASEFVRERLHSDALSSHKLSIPHTATVVGRSLALSSAVGMVCLTSEQLNRRIRWRINPSVLCVGSLTEAGVVEESPLQVLLRKIQLAFFSPIKKVVIHTQQTIHALNEVERLRGLYPHRNLAVVGVTTLQDCFDHRGIVQEEIRSPFARAKQTVRKHALPLAGVGVLLLLLIAGYFWYEANYDYPNLEHALGLKIGQNSIVYNPKDSLEWCIRDGMAVVDPHIPFGDIAIGDGFTRNFWIWNLTPRAKEVEIVLEGKDSLDWYINWNSGIQVFPEKQDFRMSVMFAPLSEGRGKSADLVLRDPDGKEELYSIRLTGSSGTVSGGYALRLDGVDDMIAFGKRSTVFDSDEGTFECWVRPLSARGGTLIHNGSNLPDEVDYQNLNVTLNGLDSIYLVVGSIQKPIALSAGERFGVGKWSHVAVSYSIPRGRVALMINGEAVYTSSVPFFIQGRRSPYVTLGCRNDGSIQTSYLEADLDEVRFWHVFRAEAEVQATMNSIISGGSDRLYGYWTFDHDNETTAFTATNRSENGEFIGRPSLIRSDIPDFKWDHDGGERIEAMSDSGIILKPFTYLQCTRNPLTQWTDATFVVSFRGVATDTVSYFAIVNNGHVLELRGDVIEYGAKGYPVSIPAHQWNQFAYRSASDGKADFFLNGNPVLTLEAGKQLADRHYRFEGLQLGFFNDHYNHFGAKYYPWKHGSLTKNRGFSSLAVYGRLLTNEEMQGLSEGQRHPEQGLKAFWTFSGEPDQQGNWLDRVSGLPMHLVHVRSWD